MEELTFVPETSPPGPQSEVEQSSSGDESDWQTILGEDEDDEPISDGSESIEENEPDRKLDAYDISNVQEFYKTGIHLYKTQWPRSSENEMLKHPCWLVKSPNYNGYTTDKFLVRIMVELFKWESKELTFDTVGHFVKFKKSTACGRLSTGEDGPSKDDRGNLHTWWVVMDAEFGMKTFDKICKRSLDETGDSPSSTIEKVSDI